jgi:ketosteroid isomerase-like protein
MLSHRTAAAPLEPEVGILANVSEEKVSLVRASWEAWARGDMAALFDFYAPDIEWDMTKSQIPDMGVFQGHEGVREFFRRWAYGPFDDYYAEPEEFIDAGEEVVVRVRQGGRGKGSGVPVEMPSFWQRYTLRDGKAVRVTIHRDREEALEAAAQATRVAQRRCSPTSQVQSSTTFPSGSST